MLTSVFIKNSNDVRFAEFWGIYEHAFPKEERRVLKKQEEAFLNPAFTLQIYLEENKLIGLVAFWHYPEFVFLEHLAINHRIRSKGYGSTMMKDWMNTTANQNTPTGEPKPIIGEIELVTDTITQKRLTFYERLGFVLTNIDHAQPSFIVGKEPIPMHILSYPAGISQELYKEFFLLESTEIIQPA